MFSEALKILDENTVQYMVEQQQAQIDEQIERIFLQQEQIGQQEKQIGEQQEQIGQQEKQIRDFKLALIARVRKKYRRGKTISEAAEELEEEVLTVQSIYNLIAESPEKTDEEIVLMYKK